MSSRLHPIASLFCGAALLTGSLAGAQSARDLQPAQTSTRPGETEEQHGARLLDAMLKALGGDAWLNKRTQYVEGQEAPFFNGQPSGGVERYVAWKLYGQGTQPTQERVEFVSYRGMIEPGTVRQVMHLWTPDKGYEFTFKGRSTLPEKQVAAYMRRREHSLENVMRNWVHQPGVVILFSGSGERDRRPVDKVTILTANNDNVTLDIEQGTHFPLQRSFEYRNEQFKDHDLEEEVYGDWRLIDGIGTPMNTTDYHNGEIVAQNFYKKVVFNQPLEPAFFSPDQKFMKKK